MTQTDTLLLLRKTETLGIGQMHPQKPTKMLKNRFICCLVTEGPNTKVVKSVKA